MMKLRLIRSWTNKFGRKYPIGQLMRTDNELGQFLLDGKYALDSKEFDETNKEIGKKVKKVKSDFFKPK